MESWIYRLFCTRCKGPERLLYVGISDSPSCRMANHQSDKWWWWLVDKVEWKKCWDRSAAESQESSAIASEKPLFNKSQSDLCPWERLRDIVYVLWDHWTNAEMHPLCPFCDSRGDEELLSPDGPCTVFRRNSDGALVISFPLSCSSHSAGIFAWSNQVYVSKFLVDFGRCPTHERDMLLLSALNCGKAYCEPSGERYLTLEDATEAEFARIAHHRVALLEAK